MLFCDLLTQSAQHVLPQVRKKGLVYCFDCVGPTLHLCVSRAALQRAMHRMFLAITDVIDAGFVMWTAESVLQEGGRFLVTVHAAGTGICAADGAISAVLRRLHLQEVEGRGASPHGTRKANGRCPATGAEVMFTLERGEGAVFSWQLSTRADVVAMGREPPHARGASAWLVSTEEGGLDSVNRRLSRSGWATTSMRSLGIAKARFDEALHAGRPPSLLIVAEGAGDELAFLQAVNQASPSTWAILGVLEGSPTIERRGGVSVDIRLLPLSPTELEDFTRHIDTRSSNEESRASSPMPLYDKVRSLVLVVDDDPINLLVARGLLELLGHDVEVASNGEAALLLCISTPPDIVLMDINMPGIDGIETTRLMRLLQAEGRVSPFPILVATSMDLCELQERLKTVTTDGYIMKPFLFATLEGQLRRLLPERPTRQ